jgi:hypothetical protein
MKSQKRVQKLICDGERRMKILSSMDIDLAAKSPFIDNVLDLLKNNPDRYNQAVSLIDSQEDNLSKIRVSIECLKKLDRLRNTTIKMP